MRARVVEFRLEKVKAVWWERLLSEKTRQHWLRVDFQNWKDEEDLGEEPEPFEEVRPRRRHTTTNMMGSILNTKTYR